MLNAINVDHLHIKEYRELFYSILVQAGIENTITEVSAVYFKK